MASIFFESQLDYIAAVTRGLNIIPGNKDFYIHVELRETDTHKKIGAWSDEIAHDSWYFDPNINDTKEN